MLLGVQMNDVVTQQIPARMLAQVIRSKWLDAVLGVRQCREDLEPRDEAIAYWEGKRDAYRHVYVALTGIEP